MGAALRHGWRYVRHRGLGATVGTIISRYVWGREECIVICFPLAGPPAPDRVDDIGFRLATPLDLEGLQELEPYGRGSLQRTYVQEDDDLLFVARRGDHIVATRRYSREVPPHSLTARVVTLRRSQIWMADTFCLPECRNQGLNRHLGRFTMRYLATLGYTECLAAIAVTNVPSLRSMAVVDGRQPLYHISDFRLLLYQRLRVSKSIPQEARGWLKCPERGAAL